MVCHDKPTKDWLVNRVPTLLTREGSGLKLVGLDAFHTYGRVVAWFPGPAVNAERYLLWLRRLNQGLDNGEFMNAGRNPRGSVWCSALMQPLSAHWRS